MSQKIVTQLHIFAWHHQNVSQKSEPVLNTCTIQYAQNVSLKTLPATRGW